jgi:hypothetical protein
MKISVNTLFAVAFMTLFMVATYDYLSTGFKSFNFVAGEQFKLKPSLFFEGAQAAVPKKPEDRITVVNVGNLSRGEIGDQIRNIIQFKPKVIGIDIIFACEKRDSLNCPQAYDPINNFKFYTAIISAEAAGIKVVMAERLLQSSALADKKVDVPRFDSIEHSDPELLQNSTEGYINLFAYETDSAGLLYCREVAPYYNVNGAFEKSFAVEIANAYDSIKAENFLQRGNSSELINFRGNTVTYQNPSPYAGYFTFLDAAQALDTATFTPDIIKDRIVLFGFHGNDLTDDATEDKYLTPLNFKSSSGLVPDMFGVVIHANIISMILNEDFIEPNSLTSTLIISLLVSLISAPIFIAYLRMSANSGSPI